LVFRRRQDGLTWNEGEGGKERKVNFLLPVTFSSMGKEKKKELPVLAVKVGREWEVVFMLFGLLRRTWNNDSTSAGKKKKKGQEVYLYLPVGSEVKYVSFTPEKKGKDMVEAVKNPPDEKKKGGRDEGGAVRTERGVENKR